MQFLFSKLSIRSKLLSQLLLVSLLSVVIIGSLGYRSGREALTASITNQLTSLRAARSADVQRYFQNIRHQIQTLSEQITVVEAMQNLKKEYSVLHALPLKENQIEELKNFYRQDFIPKLAQNIAGEPLYKEYFPKSVAAQYLQYHYGRYATFEEAIAVEHAGDSSKYSNWHQKYHRIFADMVLRYDYNDIYLVDNVAGNVIYTTFKGVDIGTNLYDGPYRTSGLAQVVEAVDEAPDRGMVYFSDFAAYRPSYAEPAAFAAAPIYAEGKMIGVLTIEMPITELNRVMTSNGQWQEIGLGQTGETYLVGSDYLLRSNTRFFVEDPETYLTTMRNINLDKSMLANIERLETTILQQKVETDSAQKAIEKGLQGVEVIEDYRNILVLSAYAPIEVEGLRWAIIAERDLSEAYAPVYAFERLVLLATALLMVGITLAAMYLAGIFTRPLEVLLSAIRQVEAGEVNTRVQITNRDEFGELAHSFNQMLDNLNAERAKVEAKQRENELLLLNILPAPVAKRVSQGESDVVDYFSQVTVLFAEVRGFTQLVTGQGHAESGKLLNELIIAFDEAADQRGVEKLKTFGATYMAVCGLTVPRLDHSKRMVEFAQEMFYRLEFFNAEHDSQLALSIGIHTGPVAAGIVGVRKFIYDIWGETVSIASHMRDIAPPNAIVVSQSVHESVGALFQFNAYVANPAEINRDALDQSAWRLVNDQRATKNQVRETGATRLIIPAKQIK